MTFAHARTRVFFEGGVRYTVVRRFDAGATAHEGRPLASHEARWALRRILAPVWSGEIVGAYQALLGGTLPAVDEADVRLMHDALLEAAGRGDILVFELGLVGSSTRREVEEGPAQPAPWADPREEKTWIAIVLVDEADPPAPVPSARYRIDLPDGSTREGTLDGQGRAWIDGIDPGTCKVSFPGLHAPDWKKAG